MFSGGMKDDKTGNHADAGMDCERRAKIFSPFDALKGFSEMLAVHTDPAVFRTVTLAKRTVRAEDIPEM